MLETGTEIGTDVRVGEGIVESVTNYVFNSIVNLEIPEQKLLWQRALITPYSSFFYTAGKKHFNKKEAYVVVMPMLRVHTYMHARNFKLLYLFDDFVIEEIHTAN